MIKYLTSYLESVVEEAADRDNDIIRTIDSYLENRRENAGFKPSFVPVELELDLTDEVFYHPIIVELSAYVGELIILDNVSPIFRFSCL